MLLNKDLVDVEASKASADISFVLERKVAAPGQNNSQTACASKVPLFSVALVMCVACLSNFLNPMGSAGVAPTVGTYNAPWGTSRGLKDIEEDTTMAAE